MMYITSIHPFIHLIVDKLLIAVFFAFPLPYKQISIEKNIVMNKSINRSINQSTNQLNNHYKKELDNEKLHS